jgi:cobalt-zinc-cadmium efflux system outer membrane protein
VAQRRLVLLQKQLDARLSLVKLIKQRYEVGEISQPELTLAEMAVNQARIELAGTDAGLSEAQAKFAASLGIPLEAIKHLKTSFDFSISADTHLKLAEARDLALRGRADILAALADYAVAEDELQLQIARQYPDLHLGPGYAWNNGNAGDNQWSLGLTLELPLLDQNQGPIAQAKAQRQLAGAKFLALQSQIIAQIDQAEAGLNSVRKQQTLNRAQVAGAEQQLKSVEQQASAGAAEPLDVLNARLELYSAQLVMLDSEAQLAVAVGGLEDALQQPGPTLVRAVENISNQK